MAAVFRATFGLMDSQHMENRPDRGEHFFRGRGATGLTELTASGTSGKVQLAAADFAAPRAGYVTMAATTAVWVQIAAVPVAAIGTDWFREAKERLTLELVEGDKIAVIDDS